MLITCRYERVNVESFVLLLTFLISDTIFNIQSFRFNPRVVVFFLNLMRYLSKLIP